MVGFSRTESRLQGRRDRSGRSPIIREVAFRPRIGHTSGFTAQPPNSREWPMTASESDPKSSQSASGDSAASASSGFDTMLGKLVVDQGFVTEEELQQCKSELLVTREEGDVTTLEEALVHQDFMTRRQLARLRVEFDTAKSQHKIPGYRFIKKLNKGAMGIVLLAEQTSLNRKVAIKILPSKLLASKEDVLTRFYEEGRAAAKLNHPNIVHAYEVGQVGDNHFFVMEYVEGSDIKQEIRAKKRFGEADAIEIMIQAARALEHAHSKKLIHRDIKPANLMLTRNGTVKVADLGLARSLNDTKLAEQEKGRAYGTPFYISPEQIRGEIDIGPPADIYGLGATCYHMVTGREPFLGKNPSEVMRHHLKTEITPPDDLNPSLSPGFCQVIEMMLAKKREDRYESATDLLEDLQLIQQGESPHFAKPAVDLNSLAVHLETPTSVAGSTAAVPRRDSQSIMSNPIMLPLILSLVGNLVLFILLVLLNV